MPRTCAKCGEECTKTKVATTPGTGLARSSRVEICYDCYYPDTCYNCGTETEPENFAVLQSSGKGLSGPSKVYVCQECV